MSAGAGSADTAGADRVIGRMRAIRDELDEPDGVARFNGMYLAVTEAVRDELAADRAVAPVRDHYLLTLGRMVGLAGRGLLIPAL